MKIVILILGILSPVVYAQSRELQSPEMKSPSQALSMPFIQPIHADTQPILVIGRLTNPSRALIDQVERLLNGIIDQGEVPQGLISGPFRLPTTQALLEYRRFYSSIQEKRYLSLEFQDYLRPGQRAELVAMLIGEPNWMKIELYLELVEPNNWTIINGNVFLLEDRLKL